MNEKRSTMDPEKMKAWKTNAVVQIRRELPKSKVPIPSDESVEIAREFVNENQK
jgi:hypothetical protein